MSEKHWLEHCRWCKKKHRVEMRPCPTCGVYLTPQPVSDRVYNRCMALHTCDGCIAYEDHLRV